MAFNKAKALQEAEKSVIQGKTSQAIKQYLQIVEKDPSDLTLLNTIGDLYVREKNNAEALKQFHKLADAYVQEGFTVKAIAIYKKISKLDPNSVDSLLKLAELYQIQGLGREAREQYAQALEFYRKKNQNERALEVLRKIVQLDPENAVFRTRLAEFCEQLGRKGDAAQAYLEVAEAAVRRGDIQAAEPALNKAAGLDTRNPQVHLLRARLALSKDQPDQVEKIINSVPDLSAKPAARQLLLEAYLATHKVEAAEKLVVDVFRSNPADFEPVASFAALCIERGDFDAALKPLSEVADELMERKNTGPLMDSLRQIWLKSPQHVATLESIYRICERTADEFTLPEILEALGHAYVQAGELEKAETIYRKLLGREPENEHYKGLLKQILQKQGKEYAAPSLAALSSVEMALAPEAEASVSPAVTAPAADAEQAAMVKEALENSDLFSRYGLVDKAVHELEKVLAVYPDQVDIHKRIHEICQRNQPARSAQAAEALARIYKQRRDTANARRYEALARQPGGPAAGEEPAMPTEAREIEVPSPPPPSVAAPVEIDLSQEVSAGAPEETPLSAPEEIQLDLAASPGTGVTEAQPFVPAPAEAHEFDLSSDLEALTASTETPAAEEKEGPAFNYEDSRVEVDFYLEQGFLDEAQQAVQALEEKFPGVPQVAELRQRLEGHVSAGKPAAPAPEAAPVEETPEPAKATEAPEIAPAAAGGGWELPDSFAASAPPETPPPGEAPVAPEALRGVAAASTSGAPEPAAVGSDLLGSLVGDLAESLEGFGGPPPTPPARAASGSASPLAGLLEELGEGAEADAAQEDPETHYSLGVAFREMGLLDEAIGEFQKVLKGTQKGKFPPNYLQCCSLLATCFMDKKMPAIAAKWYLRALQSPDLEEEATLALLYDLGAAYEQAGDLRTALEKFTEVYSQNIDFRDVAEKIRLLQQKPS